MIKSGLFFRCGLIFLYGFLPLTTQAVEVNFTGNLIDNPPCEVSGQDGENQPIKVPFGELGIKKIDGLSDNTEYGRQDFTLTLNCGTGLGNTVALYLEYRGVTASFDPSKNTLQSSINGLGIRLYRNNKVVPPNSGAQITMSDNGTSTARDSTTK